MGPEEEEEKASEKGENEGVVEVPPPKTLAEAEGFVKIPVNKVKAKKEKISAKKVLRIVRAGNTGSIKKPLMNKVARKAKKSKRTKPLGPGTLKFKFKATRSRAVCDVLNCKAKPSKGFRCPKHKKLIRKAQLAANNIVWKKRVKAGTAGHHVVYTNPKKKTQATRWALKATNKAMKVHSGAATLKTRSSRR